MHRSKPGSSSRLSKTALIVDDSKSARFILKRMLETHALEVATAESAENALEYLNDHRPDVIFMDHMMPGMDGFEAVTAIKNNPETATIPIMMYTSQKGEVYVGQARALGAVGVLPKEVEPVAVSKVLQSLHVIDNDKDDEPATSTAPEETGNFAALEDLDINIRLLIEDLFDQQRAILRRDLLDSYETIASRVAEEIRAPAEVEPPSQQRSAGGSGRYRYLAWALAALTLLFGWLYWEREQGWREVSQQNEALREALVRQQSMEAQATVAAEQQLSRYERSLDSAYGAALDGIGWRMNQDAGYAYDAIPLGDAKLAQFEALVAQLVELNYFGQVVIEIHRGDFCLSRAGADNFVPAEATIASDQCDAIGFEPGIEIPRQSVAFANFMNTAQQTSSGQIRFEVVDIGNSAPVAAYPSLAAELSAGEWNAVAQRNHRVQVVLDPDS